jgi:hypothetical protein
MPQASHSSSSPKPYTLTSPACAAAQRASVTAYSGEMTAPCLRSQARPSPTLRFFAPSMAASSAGCDVCRRRSSSTMPS